MNGLGSSVSLRCSHREELRRAVEQAHHQRRRLRVVGGGRRSVADGAIALRAPSGVLDLWSEDLVARVGAATTVAELDRQLAPLGLETGLVVPLPERATLGGIFASGEGNWVGGPNRGLRELALGALVFDGRGRPMECGARVVKNVAGYDTLRLHHGAGGGFGVLADFVLRLRACPETRRAVFLERMEGDLPSALLGLRQRTGGDTVGEIVVDAEAARRTGLGSEGGVYLVAEGRRSVLEAWSAETRGVDRSDALGAVRDLGWAESDSAAMILRVTTRTSRLLEVWPRLRRELAQDGRRVGLVYDTRTGVARVLAYGTYATDAAARQELVGRVADQMGPTGIDRGSVEAAADSFPTRDRWLRRLREHFDPAGILPPPRVRGGGRA